MNLTPAEFAEFVFAGCLAFFGALGCFVIGLFCVLRLAGGNGPHPEEEKDRPRLDTHA